MHTYREGGSNEPIMHFLAVDLPCACQCGLLWWVDNSSDEEQGRKLMPRGLSVSAQALQ